MVKVKSDDIGNNHHCGVLDASGINGVLGVGWGDAGGINGGIRGGEVSMGY